MTIPALINRQQLFSVLFALAAAVIVFLLVSVFYQNTVHRILLQGYFLQDTAVTVSSVSDDDEITVIGNFEFKAQQRYAGDQPQYEGTRILNVPIKNLQLDFELLENPNVTADRAFSLASIEVPMPYSMDYYFGQTQIDLSFDSQQSSIDNAAYYTFDDGTGRVTLRSKESLGSTNYLLVLVLPVLFFFGVLFLIRQTQWREIPAFKDMSLGKTISSDNEFNTVNGLRGLAAILVLLSHSAPGWESVQMGLAFLFVISGFLLTKPFVLDNHKIFNLANIERYLTKRLKRILPMYYVFIFITYVVTFEFDTAFRHFLFIQAENHLWPMTQIFAFYMLLPFVLIIVCFSYKLNRFFPFVLLSLGIYYSITLMANWTPFFNGTYSHNFFLYAFLLGVFASYLQYDLIRNWSILHTDDRWKRELIGLAALIVTVLVILWSAPMKPSMIIFQYIDQFYIKCILSASIILLALNTPGTLFNFLISNWLFRSVGVIGFSFYLLHGLGMQIADNFALQFLDGSQLDGRSWEYFFGAFCVTYVLAIGTYSYIERPFFGYRVKR